MTYTTLWCWLELDLYCGTCAAAINVLSPCMQFDVCTDQTSRLAYSKEFCTMLPHRTADAAAIAAAKCQTRSASLVSVGEMLQRQSRRCSVRGQS